MERRKGKACAADHTLDRNGRVTCDCQVLGSLKKVVAMLAEIFMVRLEAAARLQEQTASLSSSPFVALAPSHQFLFKDNTARPVDRSRREGGNGQVS